MYSSAVSTITKLKKLESKRDTLMKDLLATKQMIRGTFGINYRRCGTHTCWCYSAKVGHPHDRISWTENATSFTRVIPKDKVEWVKVMTANYKRFRTARKKLREINEEIRILLNELEGQIVAKTKKYL